MIYSGRWKPSPITAEENTYLPSRSVKARQRQTEGWGAFTSESPPVCIRELFWWNICLWRCVLWLLFNYFSPYWWSPAALYSPYLSSLDFPPCQRASSRLLCLRLEVTWIKQLPTLKLCLVLKCIFMYLWKTNLHCAAVWVLTGCKSTQICPVLERATATLFTNHNKSMWFL